MLDGLSVTESEATAALRMAAGSRISQVSLLAHTRTDTIRPRSLSLASCAQLLTQISRNKPDRHSENDSEWYSKVSVIGSLRDLLVGWLVVMFRFYQRLRSTCRIIK